MAGPNDAAVIPRVLAHYARCATLLERSFGGSPIVFADFPRGLYGGERFRITHIPLSAERIGWLVRREYAIEFHGWAPVQESPERLRFGRIAVLPESGAGFRNLKEGALAVRQELLAAGLDAIPVLDGLGGATLWLPLLESPPAAKIRLRAERICTRLGRKRNVTIDATINAAGCYSPLPYSLRGAAGLPVCAPVAWEEFARLRSPVVCTAETFPAHFAKHGDLFAQGVERLSSQRLRAARRVHAAG
jgi:DNA primase